MKKYILLLLLIVFLFSCDPNNSPKFIDEKVFSDMREMSRQKVTSSYSFDFVFDFYVMPRYYVLHIDQNGDALKKSYRYIKGENVENMTDEEISAKLLKRKNELGDAYEESYEKICIENINSIDDIFSFIFTMYQNEVEKYKQKPDTSYFVSKIEYDETYLFPSYFSLKTQRDRPMMPTGSVGIIVNIKNFQQI